MTPFFAQQNTFDLAAFAGVYGYIVVLAVLGGAAIYLMLPRPRRYPWPIGVLVGLTALATAGVWLITAEANIVEAVLFYCFASLAILAGGVMITQTQPVKAALSFALVILSTCGLFLLQAAPFLMAATIAVYAGAIIVTFLFVIMLAQQSGLSNADYRSREPMLACIAGFVLLAAVLCVLCRSFDTERNTETIATLDGFMKKIDDARRAKSRQAIKEALGDPTKSIDKLHNLAQDLQKKKETAAENMKTAEEKLIATVADHLEQACNDVTAGWIGQDEVDVLRKNLEAVYLHGMRLQYALQGVLQPPPQQMQLSPFSGTPANVPPPRDKTGRARMPADNVAALGRSLFTDYLLAVELAATLLLVATIGAIAIATRKAETLR